MKCLFSSFQVAGLAVVMATATAAQEPDAKLEGSEHLASEQSQASHCFENQQGARYRVEGSGPLLIYIAGMDGTGELFYKQMPALTRSYRVVTFRLRERGRFTYDDLTGDVAAIIIEIGDLRATIVGESFGGTIAMQFAIRFPEMVERLIVVNSFPRFRPRWKIYTAATFAPIVPPKFTWLLRRGANKLGLMLDGVGSEDRRRFFQVVRSVKTEGYARRLRLVAELDIENRLSEIQAPTLFIAGTKDYLVKSVREALAMAARMPNAGVKIIEGAGHACLLGNKVILADLLAEWIAQGRQQIKE
ncbi:MAG: alpha/beta fold hydrolase [Blastocatellia bacterium]